MHANNTSFLFGFAGFWKQLRYTSTAQKMLWWRLAFFLSTISFLLDPTNGLSVIYPTNLPGLQLEFRMTKFSGKFGRQTNLDLIANVTLHALERSLCEAKESDRELLEGNLVIVDKLKCNPPNAVKRSVLRPHQLLPHSSHTSE
jgi:hypothetical protein